MIRNLTRQTVLSYRTFQAVSFGDRLRGMIGRPFEQIGSIHTFFMTFSIDVAFLGADNTVLATHPDCRPWRPVVSCRGAQSVIELPAGALAHTGTLPGDRLDLNAETVPPEKRTK